MANIQAVFELVGSAQINLETVGIQNPFLRKSSVFQIAKAQVDEAVTLLKTWRAEETVAEQEELGI